MDRSNIQAEIKNWIINNLVLSVDIDSPYPYKENRVTIALSVKGEEKPFISDTFYMEKPNA